MDFVAEWIHNEGTGMHTQWAQRLTLSGMSVGLLLAARQFLKRRNALKLQGQVILITGGSRGLGFALAHKFARQGTRLVCWEQSES
jgi:NADPH:quinone reductase-like Zn-dependent oxidoreductase